jgi:short subunit dehydrogenase-like uncharacterized protein
MAERIVVFGATGYTGDLTARALVARGARPVLAARNEERVRALASELGDLEWAVADVARPESVRALVERADVLVSTVGPFARWGEPAVEAAIAAGAHYLDSTGEGSFIREVFERYGGAAQAAGCGLLTAFGFDWVPGNLAGALALRDAGEAATRVEVGYFSPGAGAGSMSGGTRASAAGVAFSPGFAWRGGRLVDERPARRTRSFALAPGRAAPAVSVATSEHFALPRVHPTLRDVDVYLGWFGPLSEPMRIFTAVTEPVLKLPGAREAAQGLFGHLVKGSTGGPDAAARAQSRSVVLAEAFDGSGTRLAEVRLEGVNGYDLTAGFLAWGAQAAAAGGLQGTGALGPVDGFGLDALEAGCAEAGLARERP